MNAVEHTDFCVNTMLNEIVVDGCVVKVTRGQANISEVLFKRFPQAASIDSIMCGYWGFEDWKDVGIIRSQFCMLRIRLKETRLKIVKEKYGGYRFCLDGNKPLSQTSPEQDT